MKAFALSHQAYSVSSVMADCSNLSTDYRLTSACAQDKEVVIEVPLDPTSPGPADHRMDLARKKRRHHKDYSYGGQQLVLCSKVAKRGGSISTSNFIFIVSLTATPDISLSAKIKADVPSVLPFRKADCMFVSCFPFCDFYVQSVCLTSFEFGKYTDKSKFSSAVISVNLVLENDQAHEIS